LTRTVFYDKLHLASAAGRGAALSAASQTSLSRGGAIGGFLAPQPERGKAEAKRRRQSEYSPKGCRHQPIPYSDP